MQENVSLSADGKRVNYARYIFAVSVFIVFAVLFISAGVEFYNVFPTGHSWSEMLINYQGGFTKRALVGDIAFRINHWIPAQTFIAVLLTTLYLAVAAWTVWIVIIEKFSPASILFLASPAGLLFAIHDPAAFGRKDVIILAAFAAAVTIIRKAQSPTVAFLSVLAIYLLVGFAIEAAWFYMPLALVLILFKHQPSLRWYLLAGGIVTLYAVAIYPAAAWHGDVSAGIIKSWQTLHPHVEQNALCCIGVNFSQASSMALIAMRSAGLGYAASFALALVPVVALLAGGGGGRLPRVGSVAWAALIVAVIVALGPIALAADCGRYIIHLAIFHVFMIMTVILSRSEQPRNASLLMVCAVAGLYGTLWITPHFSTTSGILGGVLWRAIFQ